MNQEKKKRTKVLRTIVSALVLCFWVAVSVIAVQLLTGYILTILINKINLAKPVWTTIYSAVSYILAMVLIILVPLIVRRKKVDKIALREDLGLIDSPTWTDVGLAPIGFIVSTVLAAGLVALFTFFPWFNAEETQSVGFDFYMSGGERVVAFLTLVVIAPIAEEIIFRGWLYTKVRNKFNGKMPEKAGMTLSILIVSITFGLVHLQWNVGVNVFALSVVLCVLREITGTVYAGILTHMVKNGVAFFLLYVIGIV